MQRLFRIEICYSKREFWHFTRCERHVLSHLFVRFEIFFTNSHKVSNSRLSFCSSRKKKRSFHIWILPSKFIIVLMMSSIFSSMHWIGCVVFLLLLLVHMHHVFIISFLSICILLGTSMRQGPHLTSWKGFVEIICDFTRILLNWLQIPHMIYRS